MVAWDNCPLFLETTPHVRLDPGSFFKLYVLHVYHLGMGRDFAASCMALLLDFYEAGSVPSAIDCMNADLKLFLTTTRRQVHFKLLSRGLLGYSGDGAFPAGHWSKAMDTPVLVEFIVWVLGRHPRKVSQDRLLQVMESAGTAIGMCMRAMLNANLWMDLDETNLVAQSGLHFLQCYGKLASICHARSLCKFNLTPKLHCWHHICGNLLQLAKKKIPFTLNPLAESCFSDEDFVGRVSRISRRVSPRPLNQRTLERYLAMTRQQLDAEG